MSKVRLNPQKMIESQGVKLGDSKKRILTVATQQFADRGFEGVVIRDIARAADVTLPTIYHFFGDKRKLYEQTCTELFEEKNELLKEALSSSEDPMTRLWNFTAKLLSILIEDTVFARLLQRELVEQDYFLIDSTVQASLQPHFQMLAEAVDKLTHEVDTFDRSISIYSLSFGLAALRPVWQRLNDKRPKELKTPTETTSMVLKLVFPDINWDIVIK